MKYQISATEYWSVRIQNLWQRIVSETECKYKKVSCYGGFISFKKHLINIYGSFQQKVK